MRWVIAVEEDQIVASRHADLSSGRLHAYDAIKCELAHPLSAGYTVREQQRWDDAFPGPRCLHCVEIAGAPDK